MADTAKIMDVLHNAKQIVTDAVEKVTKEMVIHVQILLSYLIAGEVTSSNEIERPD